MAEYKAFMGVVSFNPEDATTPSGKKLRKFTIKLVNSVDDVTVGVTLWEELRETEVSRGDFVAVEGSYTNNPGKEGRVFHNLSASRIVVLTSEQGTFGTAKAAAIAPKTQAKVTF